MTLNEIKNYICNAGTESIGIFGGNVVNKNYSVQQNPDEFAELINYLQCREYENYLEIGAAEGGATRILYELLKIKNVFIVDDNKHPIHKIRPENLKNIPHIEFIGDSHSIEARDWVYKNSDYDLVFIDGDHSYSGVKQDTEMVLPVVKHGGFIFYHDTTIVPDVRQHAQELKQDSRLEHVADFSHKFGISLFKVR